MTETQKTLVAAGAAVLLLAVAAATRPTLVIDTADSSEGQEFYPEFKHPEEAESLEIVSFDDKSATITPFKVAKVDGAWSIPSHSNYPADADQQMATAAANLIGIKRLKLVSKDPSEHEVFGVVEPDPKKLTVGATGVGKRVTLTGANGKKLVDYIVGKADEKQTHMHFVRVPGQDAVFRAEINIDKLSTKFEDWIEKDLLKLNAFDIKEVTLDDHSVDVLNRTITPRSRIKLAYDSKDAKWIAETVQTFNRTSGAWDDAPLAADEELDTGKLNDLKNALDDLKIVDVSPKPKSLRENLKLEQSVIKDAESLSAHGFHLARMTKDGPVEFFSNEGEVRARMKDGVEYILRFGEIAGQSKEEAKDGQGAEGEKKPAADASGVSRYILVTATFNESLLDKPDLLPVPGAGKPEQPKPADGKKPEDKPQGAADGEAKKDAAPKDESKTDEQKAADKQAEEEKAKAEAEKKRIETENKRMQDEYDKKVADGQKRVKELNERFSAWYYVISDATYQKIHLGRKDIVKKKEPPKDDKPADESAAPKPANPLEQFEAIKKEGLKE